MGRRVDEVNFRTECWRNVTWKDVNDAMLKTSTTGNMERCQWRNVKDLNYWKLNVWGPCTNRPQWERHCHSSSCIAGVHLLRTLKKCNIEMCQLAMLNPQLQLVLSLKWLNVLSSLHKQATMSTIAVAIAQWNTRCKHEAKISWLELRVFTDNVYCISMHFSDVSLRYKCFFNTFQVIKICCCCFSCKNLERRNQTTSESKGLFDFSPEQNKCVKTCWNQKWVKSFLQSDIKQTTFFCRRAGFKLWSLTCQSLSCARGPGKAPPLLQLGWCPSSWVQVELRTLQWSLRESFSSCSSSWPWYAQEVSHLQASR